MSLALTNDKRYSHAYKYYIVYTTKVPNIVTVLLVTVCVLLVCGWVKPTGFLA